MVDENEACEAVRELMKRFDLINAQRLSVAYVLAESDAEEYAKLLAVAEDAEKSLIAPQIAAEHAKVYATLDNPNADWPKATLELLDTRPIVEIKKRSPATGN